MLQEALFYSFRIEDHVRADHLLRSIDQFFDLWPTITMRAPASASIAAEIEPVCAPALLAWQSCAPIDSLGAAFAASASNVAGKHSAT